MVGHSIVLALLGAFGFVMIGCSSSPSGRSGAGGASNNTGGASNNTGGAGSATGGAGNNTGGRGGAGRDFDALQQPVLPVEAKHPELLDLEASHKRLKICRHEFGAGEAGEVRRCGRDRNGRATEVEGRAQGGGFL